MARVSISDEAAGARREAVRDALRTATAGAHERLDAATGDLDLAERDSYGRFLQAQSGPVLALERGLEAGNVTDVLPDWPQRTRREALCDDLALLGLPIVECRTAITFGSKAEMLGALYVLEGSRLGARFLMKRLDAAPDIRRATKFLSHGAGQRLWTSFLAVLEKHIHAGDLSECIGAATESFSLFETSFAIILQRPPSPPILLASALQN